MVLKSMSYIGINLYFGGFFCCVLNEILPWSHWDFLSAITSQEGKNSGVFNSLYSQDTVSGFLLFHWQLSFYFLSLFILFSKFTFSFSRFKEKNCGINRGILVKMLA